MVDRLDDHPDHGPARQLQRTHAQALMALFGAHAASVEWIPDGAGGRVPGVVLYRSGPVDQPGSVSVPPVLTIVDEAGRPAEVRVRAVDGPAASEE